MKLRVQVVIESDDDAADEDPQSPVVHEVATIERGDLSVDTLGMQLAEAKDLLQRVQEESKSTGVGFFRSLLGSRPAAPASIAFKMLPSGSIGDRSMDHLQVGICASPTTCGLEP